MGVLLYLAKADSINLNLGTQESIDKAVIQIIISLIVL